MVGEFLREDGSLTLHDIAVIVVIAVPSLMLGTYLGLER
jgi:hypothetical protein